MGSMITTDHSGVQVIECDTCNDCPVEVWIDGRKVKSFKGETAVHAANRLANETIIKRVHA
jgi:hypothetical protein